MNNLILKSGRSTKLKQNLDMNLKINISISNSSEKSELAKIMMILGDILVPINHLGIASMNGITIMVPSQKNYMIINTSAANIEISFDQNQEDFPIIFDPYYYEDESHITLIPKDFKEKFEIPEGYIDVLAKWYSIKFTYPDYNYIFIRPGLGISLQTHSFREEYWDIIKGNPIIINGSKIFYQTQPRDKFYVPLGNMHTVINTSEKEWVLFKEEFKGKFDENDIIRVFNPNHYN